MFVFFFTPVYVAAHAGAFRDLRFSNNSQRSGQWGLLWLHKPRQKNGSWVCSGDWVKGGLAHHIGNLPELMLPGGLASSLKSKSEKGSKSLPLRSPWEKCEFEEVISFASQLANALQGCLDESRLFGIREARTCFLDMGKKHVCPTRIVFGSPLEESMLYLNFQLIKKLFISKLPSIPALRSCFHCFCSSHCVWSILCSARQDNRTDLREMADILS